MHFREKNNEFENLTRLLKNLPKINAPSGFEASLSRKIIKLNTEEEKKSWIDKIFSPQLIPSAALAVTAVMILFLLRNNEGDAEDPFKVMPKLREDRETVLVNTEAISSKNSDRGNSAQVKTPENVKNFESNDSGVIPYYSTNNTSLNTISVSAVNYQPNQSAITAGGLNYRVVRFSESDRRQLEVLRSKIEAEIKNIRNK